MIALTERFKIPLILLLFLALLPVLTSNADAKKRKYKKEAVRQQAIKTIRENSDNVSMLAGIDPLPKDSLVDEDTPDDGEYGEDLQELELEDDVTVDFETFQTLWLTYVADDDEEEFTAGGISRQAIMDEIMNWLGTRYKFGGNNKKGIDCSAFVRTVFMETSSILLPRTAREQYTIGDDISKRNLEFGDMVFFHTRRRVYVSHVGIYLGDNLFAHASSRYGVTVSSLESTYYSKRLIGARRLTLQDLQKLSTKEESKDNL